MRNAFPEGSAGTLAVETVTPAFWNAKMTRPEGALLEPDGTTLTDPTSVLSRILSHAIRTELRGGMEYGNCELVVPPTETLTGFGAPLFVPCPMNCTEPFKTRLPGLMRTT